MSTPKENPITIRRAGLRELIQAHADKQGIIFNRAAVDLILKGLGVSPAKRILKLKRKPQSRPKSTARRQAKPVAPQGEALAPAPPSSPPSTTPSAEPKALDTSAVPFNPPRSPMQKTPSGKKRWA